MDDSYRRRTIIGKKKMHVSDSSESKGKSKSGWDIPSETPNTGNNFLSLSDFPPLGSSETATMPTDVACEPRNLPDLESVQQRTALDPGIAGISENRSEFNTDINDGVARWSPLPFPKQKGESNSTMFRQPASESYWPNNHPTASCGQINAIAEFGVPVPEVEYPERPDSPGLIPGSSKYNPKEEARDGKKYVPTPIGSGRPNRQDANHPCNSPSLNADDFQESTELGNSNSVPVADVPKPDLNQLPRAESPGLIPGSTKYIPKNETRNGRKYVPKPIGSGRPNRNLADYPRSPFLFDDEPILLANSVPTPWRCSIWSPEITSTLFPRLRNTNNFSRGRTSSTMVNYVSSPYPHVVEGAVGGAGIGEWHQTLNGPPSTPIYFRYPVPEGPRPCTSFGNGNLPQPQNLYWATFPQRTLPPFPPSGPPPFPPAGSLPPFLLQSCPPFPPSSLPYLHSSPPFPQYAIARRNVGIWPLTPPNGPPKTPRKLPLVPKSELIMPGLGPQAWAQNCEVLETQKEPFEPCSMCWDGAKDWNPSAGPPDHPLMNKAGAVVCPILRNYVCPGCGATGDVAHTRSKCPKLQAERANSSC